MFLTSVPVLSILPQTSSSQELVFAECPDCVDPGATVTPVLERVTRFSKDGGGAANGNDGPSVGAAGLSSIR
jgi:hypothetical protein